MAWSAAAVVASVGCFFLGGWQWNRWETRHASQTTITNNYDAEPAPLREILPDDSASVTSDLRWRRVKMSGTYDSDHQVLVRNRPLDGTYGFQVLVPFQMADGSTVLIDRGWLPNGASAAEPPPIPPAPTGEVTVTGWLQPVENDLGRTAVNGQVSSIRPNLVEAQGGPKMLPSAYVRMASETPAPQTRPEPLGKPDLGGAAGINLSYAVQWWLAMVAFPLLVIFAARRELPGRKPSTPRPKKVRIWDEEDA